MVSLYPQVGSGTDVVFAAWIASGSGHGIGTERGTRGRSSRSRSRVAAEYLLWSFVVVAFEGSERYVEAAAVRCRHAGAGVGTLLPGLGPRRIVESWAAGHDVDRATALDATYTWARGAIVRTVAFSAVWASVLGVVVGAIAGASGSRLVQYGILGAASGLASC